MLRGVPTAGCVLLLCACAAAGTAAIPDAPRAADALQSGCSTTDYGRPYVVDWGAMDRADLHEVERRGVVVVKYDCAELRVLTDCHLPGKYGFVSTSAEQTLVELQSAGDVRANFPVSGVSLSSIVSSDTSLALALAHGGKGVAWLDPHAALVGNCEGATHYVRGVYRGAFALATQARGQLGTAAQLFGAGGEASASGQRSYRYAAGDAARCEHIAAEAAVAPAGCDVPLRLELRTLASLHEQPSNPVAEATDFVGCPPGFVEVQGRCLARNESHAYACTPDDYRECAEQCERGDAVSCARQAYLLHHGEGAPVDLGKARELYERACRAGVQHGCSGLGVFYRMGLGVEPDLQRAFELQRAACDAGEVRGCSSLGVFFDEGQLVAKNDAEAFRLYKRACEGGLAIGCGNLGTLYRDGRSVAVDDGQAAQYFLRACLSRSAFGCDNLRDLALARRVSGAPVATLAASYAAECERKVPAACGSLERLRALAAPAPVSNEGQTP